MGYFDLLALNEGKRTYMHWNRREAWGFVGVGDFYWADEIREKETI